jgi:hypothetical protein
MIESIKIINRDTAEFRVLHKYGCCKVTLRNYASAATVELEPSDWEITFPRELAETFSVQEDAEVAAHASVKCCMEVMEYAQREWFRKFGWGDRYEQVVC